HTQNFNTLQSKFNGINTKISLYYPSYGEDEEKKPIQPDFITGFCNTAKDLKQIAETKSAKKIKERNFDVNYDNVINALNSKIKTIETSLDVKEKSLSTIKEKEEELDEKISELLDKKNLKEKYSESEEILKGLQVAALLEELTRVFNTDPLSRKTSQARKDLIAKNFNTIFKNELKGLRRSELEVNLKFRTDKATSVLLQDIGQDHRLTDVLSEGEQKAIAMAEFLTELQLDESKAPVVFDDPVTSLDHKIIEEVARRMVKMSKDRQVVVFTHSILLLNSIKQKSELPRFKGLEFKYYETDTDTEHTGFLHESPTLKEDTFKNYKSKINVILNLPKEKRDRRETELAIEGYNKLRPAIEVFVEKEMFNETVKRYRKNVALMRLETVNGALIDKHKEKVNDIYERCCGYIEPHSSPDGLPQNPTLVELEMDFKEICEIRSDFV
ncbi:MAG: AAA family ATPase, partial [Candidatus Abyssubacteria bacterium]|nr:AAA family ATPase [Candidatus Abyssubacteria bacterium]